MSPPTHFVVPEVKNFEVPQLRRHRLHVLEEAQLVVVEVERLEVGNILGDDVDGCGHDWRSEERAEDVGELGIGVELREVQSLRSLVVALDHRQLHPLLQRIVDAGLRHRSPHAD